MTTFIAHFAIQADDLGRAQRFYRSAFGWSFEPWGPPDYFKVRTAPDQAGGVTEGGLGRRPRGEERPALYAYRCSISVASVTDARSAIEGAGGRIASPIVELPGVGKVMEFEDTEGNRVAAVEYVAADRRSVAGPLLVGEVADSPRLYRVILPAGDIEASAGFYRRLLEMEGERVSPGRHYFRCGGVILAVVDPRADGDEHETRPNADHVYLSVAHLERYHERATKLGALSPEMGEIETRPWGERSFYMKDAFGNPLCFVDEKTLFLGRGEESGGE
jgi:predicted enzyme related to lactoylglutathione lyase